jgi:hypothetical protein
MVKPVVPAPVDNSLDWLMHEGGGALFSGLVPYGVHLALSECSFRCWCPLPEV